MLNKEMADMFKGLTGLDDRAMAKLHPGMQKLIKNVPKTMAH
jgi:hypothetical protein